ncbi:MAG TPA: hypothetical protein VIJ14_08725 [Rhabdochlamydiaceae bacterium]
MFYRAVHAFLLGASVLFLTQIEAGPKKSSRLKKRAAPQRLEQQQKPTQIDQIIPPEIKQDVFFDAIYRLARSERLETILEIGSSSGEGSTEAFVKGINENPFHPTLYCMEVSTVRFKALKDRYSTNRSVVCHHVSSVPVESFPSEEEVLTFMKTVNTSLRGYDPAEVISWLRRDIDYVKVANVPQNGIERIKAEQEIENFDMVLIDGSEFTGQAEFKLIYGAKFILLDDIRAFKNYQNYMALLSDTNYELIEEDPMLRNGYAIFRRL